MWKGYATIIVLTLAFTLVTDAHAQSFTTQGDAITLGGLVASNYNISTGTPLQMSLLLYDNSSLAANQIKLIINATGSRNFSGLYSGGALAPGQSEDMHLQIPQAGMLPGVYWISAYATYMQNGTVYKSNTGSIKYTVTNSTFANYAYNITSKGEAQTIPGISVSDLPIYTQQPTGSSYTSTIVVKSDSTTPETLTFSVPKAYAGLVTLSTNEVYLSSYSSELINLLYKDTNSTPNLFLVPITITEQSSKKSETLYTAFYGYKSGGMASVNRYINLLNQTVLDAALEINNPESSAQSGIRVYSYFPQGLVHNISDIQTAGINSTVSYMPNQYRITWVPSTIPPGQSAYGYYTISNVTDPSLIFNATTVISELSQPSPYSILQIENPVLPSMTVNSTNIINITAFYTGGRPQPVTFVVTAPQGIIVYDSVQNGTASPNQYISRVFGIKTGMRAGTYTMSLYISTAGANFTYTLPLIVSPAGSAANQTSNSTANSTTTGQKTNSSGSGGTTGKGSGYKPPPPPSNGNGYDYYLVLAGGVIFLFTMVLVIATIRHRKSSFYNDNRSLRLMRIKKQFEARDANGE